MYTVIIMEIGIFMLIIRNIPSLKFNTLVQTYCPLFNLFLNYLISILMVIEIPVWNVIWFARRPKQYSIFQTIESPWSVWILIPQVHCKPYMIWNIRYTEIEVLFCSWAVFCCGKLYTTLFIKIHWIYTAQYNICSMTISMKHSNDPHTKYTI